MKLTARGVSNAKAGRHGDGQGLYLVVSGTGAKSWVLRVQAYGRRRDIGLGSISVLSLAEAREEARKLRKVAKMGGDPIAERDKERVVAPTFEVAAKTFHEERGSDWDARHASAFLSSLKQHAFPLIGRFLVSSIDESDILRVLSPLWQSKPAAAKKLRQRVVTVLDYAKAKGWRTAGAPRDSLRTLLPKQAAQGNFAAVPYHDVPGVMAKLAAASGMGALALRFAILTAARSGEVRSARWEHIDLEAMTWTRPATLMKSDKEHVVTLSPEAVAVLKRARELATDNLIFPGARRGRPLADMTLLKTVKAQAGDFTVHGFRSAFRTWAAETMPTIPDAVAEAALAHSVGDAVVRAYNRAKFLTDRRKLMDAWGNYCEGRQANVVRLAG